MKSYLSPSTSDSIHSSIPWCKHLILTIVCLELSLVLPHVLIIEPHHHSRNICHWRCCLSLHMQTGSRQRINVSFSSSSTPSCELLLYQKPSHQCWVYKFLIFNDGQKSGFASKELNKRPRRVDTSSENSVFLCRADAEECLGLWPGSQVNVWNCARYWWHPRQGCRFI